MKDRYTKVEVEELATMAGGPLDTLDVTVYGDAEPMFWITTVRCPYCKRFRPHARCSNCGASPIRDGDL